MSLWDDVPDIELDEEKPRKYERTELEYPSVAPGGESWREYFLNLRGEAVEPEVEEDVAGEVYRGYEAPVITMEAEEFDEPIRSLASYVRLAHANSWEIVELAHSFATAKGKPYGAGAQEGKVREDRKIEQQWLYLQKDGVGRVAISFPIINGKTQGTGVVRRFNGTHYSDADMKRIIKGECNGREA